VVDHSTLRKVVWNDEKGSHRWLEKTAYCYSSPNIISLIKSISIRWAGHVVRMGEKRYVYRALVEKREDLGVDVNIILKWILQQRNERK
jgi:hypothetical protein